MVRKNSELFLSKNYIIENGVLVAPWDCKNDELVTLCGKCHEIVHEKEIVQIFERINDILYTTNKFNLCPKCFGEGYILEFSHVQNGVCFMCSGKGVFTRSNLTNKLQ